MQSKSALKDRRIHSLIELWCLVGSGGLEIWVLSTSFQKSDIGWPQQPPTEKVLKSNVIFRDSIKIISFSKHQCKAEFKNLNDSEVLSGDFAGLKTSAASMTSKASFHQNNYSSWWLDHPYQQKDQYQFFFEERSSNIQFFTDIWYPFYWRLLRPANITVLKTGW